MKRIDTEISINGVVFSGANSIEVVSSWEDMTDTCTILIPNKFKRNNKSITVGDNGFFKRGDEVTVKMGYFPNLETRFEGFIRRITPDNLITIECEDLMFKLKQENVNKTFRAGKLKTLIEGITSQKSNVVDADLGAVRVPNKSAAQVLATVIKETYKLQSYIRNKVLRVGLAYYPDEGKTVELHIDGIKGNIAENNLEFIDSNELKITVFGKSKQLDGNYIFRYAFYDNNGILITTSDDPRTGEYDNINIPLQTTEQLDNIIQNHLKKRLSAGINGTVTAFLDPIVSHGDVVDLKSKKFPEKEGKYLVKRVTTSMTVSGGGRQEIELDIKV